MRSVVAVTPTLLVEVGPLAGAPPVELQIPTRLVKLEHRHGMLPPALPILMPMTAKRLHGMLLPTLPIHTQQMVDELLGTLVPAHRIRMVVARVLMRGARGPLLVGGVGQPLGGMLGGVRLHQKPTLGGSVWIADGHHRPGSSPGLMNRIPG